MEKTLKDNSRTNFPVQTRIGGWEEALQGVRNAAHDVLLHFPAQFNEIRAISGYANQKGTVLFRVFLSTLQYFLPHDVELNVEESQIQKTP